MAGHADSGFESVRRVFEKNFENGEELGAGFAVIKDGKVVVNLVGGWADRKKEHPWSD
ncbi:MAG TPA: esterase, partial [Hyphomonas sp.]|nr:esterase [Hyphomonas sp.]